MICSANTPKTIYLKESDIILLLLEIPRRKMRYKIIVTKLINIDSSISCIIETVAR